MASAYSPMARAGSASYSHVEIDKTAYNQNEGGAVGGGVFGGYGGSPAGRYMVWFWIIVILVLISFIFIVLMTFPPQCLTSIDNNNCRSVDLVKVFGASVVAGLIITLIFWVIACFC